MKRVLWLMGMVLLAGARAGEFDMKTVQNDQALRFEKSGKAVLVYNLQKPADTKLSVESGGFFHPFTTPGGVVVTEVGPSDHPHHRGIFLAWVEMHGKQAADFWGWGEHAPKDGRRIVNKSVGTLESVVTPDSGTEVMPIVNVWEAEGKAMVKEELKATLRMEKRANILDLDYTLTPEEDILLSKWAFSGFCVRTLKDGQLVAESPDGEVKLPNPSHLKPESDWPDKPWYAYRIKLTSGKTVGVGVINHPKNPPTLWHNHREVRMLNPSIVAPGEVKMKVGEPLRLRYTVVAWDGATPVKLLNELHGKLK